jgi:hypothetical protein
VTLRRAVLELDAEFGDPYGQVTGVFHMYGDVTFDAGVRTGFLLGGRGSTVNAVLQDTLGNGVPKRKGVYVDLGGGQHTVQASFTGWEGAVDKDGNDLQWGASPDPSVNNLTTATGAGPLDQRDTFLNYLRVSTYDSFNPARLYTGEHSDGTYADSPGDWGEPLSVAIESPRLKANSQEHTKFDGSMTFVEILDLRDDLDGAVRNAY